MNYKTEFLTSLNNMIAVGIKEPVKSCIDTSGEFLTDENKKRIEALFSKHILNNPNTSKYLEAGCIIVNSLFKPILEDLFGEEVIITLGYTKLFGKISFDTPFLEFKRAYDTKAPRLHWETHAWLTLPSLEVIDVTFYHTMLKANESLASLLPRIKMDKNPFNTGSNANVELHPVVIGDDFLHKIMFTEFIEQRGKIDETIAAQMEAVRQRFPNGSANDVLH